MTKQEAQQEQIDAIMDEFPFRKVAQWMAHSGWRWGMGDDANIPDETDLRHEARRLLRQSCADGVGVSTGGFMVEYKEVEDPHDTWLRINLSFGYSTINDGVLYNV